MARYCACVVATIKVCGGEVIDGDVENIYDVTTTNVVSKFRVDVITFVSLAMLLCHQCLQRLFASKTGIIFVHLYSVYGD